MKRGMLAVTVSLVMFLGLIALPVQADDSSYTYTLNDDFDEGTLSGVEYDTVPDQLQLSEQSVTLPFI